MNTDPPYNVKVEPRSNNAIAAGLSSFTNTHHQGLDLARHPGKSKPTQKKLRAKDRPLANDFVSDDEFDRLLAPWSKPPIKPAAKPAFKATLLVPPPVVAKPVAVAPAVRRRRPVKSRLDRLRGDNDVLAALLVRFCRFVHGG